MAVGFCKDLSFDPERSNWDGDAPRPLSWSLWYPSAADALVAPHPEPTWFRSGPVARDAPLAPAEHQYPLVLLSHGAGGVAAGLGWLAHRLALAGFVVLGVDHHGNAGTEAYLPEGFLCLWERAADLSALLRDPAWRRRLGGAVDENASVAGFSAGAFAALLLIGARLAFSQFEPDNPSPSPVRGPREFPDLADHIPALLERSAAFRRSWERRTANFADARIGAALALAPGRSVLGFDPVSLAAIDTPLHIIGGDLDKAAPVEQCALWLHRRIARSSLAIAAGAGHYAFLPEPTPLGLAAEPEVFVDAPGFARHRFHDQVAATAARHFRAVRR